MGRIVLLEGAYEVSETLMGSAGGAVLWGQGQSVGVEINAASSFTGTEVIDLRHGELHNIDVRNNQGSPGSVDAVRVKQRLSQRSRPPQRQGHRLRGE